MSDLPPPYAVPMRKDWTERYSSLFLHTGVAAAAACLCDRSETALLVASVCGANVLLEQTDLLLPHRSFQQPLPPSKPVGLMVIGAVLIGTAGYNMDQHGISLDNFMPLMSGCLLLNGGFRLITKQIHPRQEHSLCDALFDVGSMSTPLSFIGGTFGDLLSNNLRAGAHWGSWLQLGVNVLQCAAKKQMSLWQFCDHLFHETIHAETMNRMWIRCGAALISLGFSSRR